MTKCKEYATLKPTKYYFYAGERIMKEYKYHLAVLFCSMVLCVQTSYAQWPVFDFTEIVPIIKDVKSGIDTVGDLKKQLNIKNLTLDALGKELNSFATFGKGIKKGNTSGKIAIGNSFQSIKSNMTTSQGIITDVSTVTGANTNIQKETVNGYVDQTQKILGITAAPQSSKTSSGIMIKSIMFEEEEEEEELDSSVIEEEIENLQNTVISEHKQLATELNDVLETQLTILNKLAMDNENALEELNILIRERKKLSQENRDKLQEELKQISQKQRKTSDWGISIVEAIKENYNQEYNELIKDGVNNYTKVAIAYIHGDETAENVQKAGEELKRTVNAINVTPDKEVLGELYKTMADIQSEVENLAARVDEILENT